MISEKESMKRLRDNQLVVVAVNSEAGGNVPKQEIAEEIIKERTDQNSGGKK